MRYFFILLSSLVVFSSCKVFRSNIMLKAPKDYNYDQLVDSLSQKDYKIATNDVIVYRLFTNNGLKLINLATEAIGAFRTDIDVIVESDGYVKMPHIVNKLTDLPQF